MAIASITAEDEGRAVRYRPAPSAVDTLPGKLVRLARGKEPCALVKFDNEERARPVYLSTLEWADE